MLFTPEEIIGKRHDLIEQMRAGKLTREETFQRALEWDACDATALQMLSRERYQTGDRAGAAEYAWRAAEADPSAYQPWLLLCAALDESQAFLDGLLGLGIAKALRGGEGVADFEEFLGTQPESKQITATEGLALVGMKLDAQRAQEPAEVSARLRPYRLVDEVLDAAAGLDDSLVDEVLEDAGRCGPLLVGVLRAALTGSLAAGDSAPVRASLALLGEIGDPAWLSAVVECGTIDDEKIALAADWAAYRIASRRPEESLAALREMLPDADAVVRGSMASAISRMPEAPGRLETLLSLWDGFENYPKDERHELFMGVAAALMFCAGTRGRELAWSFFHGHQELLPGRTRGELQEAMSASSELRANQFDLNKTFAQLTVHDFHGGEDEDDGGEEEDEEFAPETVRRAAPPGRPPPRRCGARPR